MVLRRLQARDAMSLRRLTPCAGRTYGASLFLRQDTQTSTSNLVCSGACPAYFWCTPQGLTCKTLCPWNTRCVEVAPPYHRE